jgi:SAM-dependent methyltransferase
VLSGIKFQFWLTTKINPLCGEGMTLHHPHPVEAAEAKRDHLWPQISSLPYFRGTLRAVEARFYENIDLPAPTLDLGCGDGHFASHAFIRPLEVGLDPWAGPLAEAAKRAVYQRTVQSEASSIPYPDAFFASAVSNSVLEHIPDLDPVLTELSRVLAAGAPFIFCVPNHRFLSTLAIGRFFDQLHLKFLGDLYRRFFNWISRHHHCDDSLAWQQRLDAAGFELVEGWDYFSPHAQHVLEWGHYLGLPSLVSHVLFRRWIIAPWRWNLFITEKFTRKVYEEKSIQEKGVYTFYVARKKEQDDPHE